jgi:hypothetical protein
MYCTTLLYPAHICIRVGIRVGCVCKEYEIRVGISKKNRHADIKDTKIDQNTNICISYVYLYIILPAYTTFPCTMGRAIYHALLIVHAAMLACLNPP